jgi:hypothetical protein
MSLHQNNKLLLVHDKRWFVSHWPLASEIGMLLITNFLERLVVAGRRWTLAGRQHAVSGRPMLIHTYHAVPMLFPCRYPAVTLPQPCRGLERSLSVRHIRGMTGEQHGNGLVCVNQMEKTPSTPLAERHGRGTARERHGIRKSAFIIYSSNVCVVGVYGLRLVLCGQLSWSVYAHNTDVAWVGTKCTAAYRSLLY